MQVGPGWIPPNALRIQWPSIYGRAFTVLTVDRCSPSVSLETQTHFVSFQSICSSPRLQCSHNKLADKMSTRQQMTLGCCLIKWSSDKYEHCVPEAFPLCLFVLIDEL